ncbi:MAG: sugar-binding domain-containing protein [Lachnospirales bacterium]
MKKVDFFHEIAKTAHPLDSTDKEIEPLEVNQHILPSTDNFFLNKEKKKSYDENLKTFKKDLKNLREYYKPFMENHIKGEEIEKIYFSDFKFRYTNENFTHRNDFKYSWIDIKTPDYRGPAGEDGKWKAYYKKIFSYPKNWRNKKKHRIIINFQCVDYKCEIYINGNYVGGHEGFFAPFSFDITNYMESENELIILCKNDISILGEGQYLDGDKIYAATGPGWDDPKVGWHHCPAGAGVFGDVSLELRPEIYIDDIFVRPDIKNDMVEVRVGVINYTNELFFDYTMDINLVPKNFSGGSIGKKSFKVTSIGSGKNEYRYFLNISKYRLWDLNTPWLYGAKVKLTKGKSTSKIETFGLKTFISDENSDPKGKFYLNGRPIVLRGANEMGHLQQCVMNDDFDQLIDDILIGKLCNMNYYRITQRPVQKEIYEYFDMLGMMHQCDFPLFGFLRRPQFSEAIKQVTEMEHLVRNHVSCIMTTFINEPVCIRRTEDPNSKFSKRYEAKGHRHLLRDELEAFFEAARKTIYIENPDRVIKNVEGDYDGPTKTGMPDFHTYTMWYTNHGQPIGKLMRGYLPPVKKGWMIGCGEYGAEGLDPVDVMVYYYPKEWIEKEKDGTWYPHKIVRAQSHSVHGDWYKEQNTMNDWINASQLHQSNATKLMTDAFRRRGDLINHTAIHLLIDAWPSGWMKTLVDFKRTPKPAYFAYKEALIPLKLNLYTGRNYAYSDETVPIETWILNDTYTNEDLTIHVEVWEGKNKTLAFEEKVHIEEATSKCYGVVPVTFNKGDATIIGALVDETGEIIHKEEIKIKVYKRPKIKKKLKVLGTDANKMADIYNLNVTDLNANEDLSLLISGTKKEDLEIMEKHLADGSNILWLLPEEEINIDLNIGNVKTKSCGELFYVVQDKKDEDLSMLYNDEKKYIDATAKFIIETEITGEDLIYTYKKNGFNGSVGPKEHLPFLKKCKVGNGTLHISSLSLKGRIGFNGGLDKIFTDIIK